MKRDRSRKWSYVEVNKGMPSLFECCILIRQYGLCADCARHLGVDSSIFKEFFKGKRPMPVKHHEKIKKYTFKKFETHPIFDGVERRVRKEKILEVNTLRATLKRLQEKNEKNNNTD